MTLLLTLLLAFLSACSLINQELPNEAPVLEMSSVDTLRVKRGGEVVLAVRASDEDDDPLFYDWRAYHPDAEILSAIRTLTPDGLVSTPEQVQGLQGLLLGAEEVGGFRDSTSSTNSWFAPETIRDSSEQFILTVTIRDRFCEVIADPQDRLACQDEGFRLIQLFVVEVVQRPPTLIAPADTAISFREPIIALDAFAEDPDGDPLSIFWEQLSGPELAFQQQEIDPGHYRLQAIPFFHGDYLFRVTAEDGSDTVSVEAAVHLLPEPELPSAGMAALSLPNGNEYEIDVYEYPNRKGELPLLADSWIEAYRLCSEQGKRLCSRTEWVNACQGSEERLYSSSDDPNDLIGRPFGFRFCNITFSEIAGEEPDPIIARAPSGTFPNCSSSSGVYDMTGNAREWVGRINAVGLWVGGYSESDVRDVVPGECGSIVELEPLPPDFDPVDPSSYGTLGSQHSDYNLSGLGFRCCR